MNYPVRYSQRAKRLSIRINSGKVEVVAPYGAPKDYVARFIANNNIWIEKQLNSHSQHTKNNRFAWPKEPRFQDEVPYFGKKLIIQDSGLEINALLICEQSLTLSINSNLQTNTQLFYEKLYNEYYLRLLGVLQGLVERYAAVMQTQPANINIKRLKSIWGSCSPRGNLSFNWLLSLTPVYVIEYLVVHEMAHLTWKNHGPRFWNKVKTSYPEYLIGYNWLKENGRFLSFPSF